MSTSCRIVYGLLPLCVDEACSVTSRAMWRNIWQLPVMPEEI
ncbi:hypothetical protein [Paenibacillus pinisoli]|nr:hypothetical protein [Paenibacillus pinisoli]